MMKYCLGVLDKKLRPIFNKGLGNNVISVAALSYNID